MITKKFHESRHTISGQLTEKLVGKVNGFKNVAELSESKKDEDGREKLIVTMEAIHVGKTRNGTYYTEKGLREGIDSWTRPYNKPVLTHHNSRDGEPIGRILSAKFEEKTLSGRAGLVFEVEISDKEAVEKVKDGRYSTVSIGGHTDSVVCNCCGTDRMNEWCEHYPGEVYDGQECHFIIGTTFGEEVSYVNTPADIHAGNVAVSTVKESATVITEDDVEDTSRPAGMAGIAASADAGVDEGDLESGKTEEGTEGDDVATVTEGAEDGAGTDEAQPPVVEEGKASPEEDPETGTVEESEGETPPSSENELEGGKTEEGADQPKGTERAGVTEGAADTTLSELVQVKIDKGLLEQENETLRQRIAVLEAEQKEHIAAKVVELKKELGRQDMAGIDVSTLVKEHAKRSLDSLKDTLADLAEEAKRAQRPAVIENPALGGSVIEGADAGKTDDRDKKASGIEVVKEMTKALGLKRR